MAINDWSVSIINLTWMVHDDNLGLEPLDVFSWGVLVFRSDTASLNIIDR